MVSPENPSEPQDGGSDDEFQRLLKQLLSGDSEGLAKAAGLPIDQNAIASIIASIQQAAATPPGQVDWSQARERAQQVAHAAEVVLTDDDRARASNAFDIARLWLSEATAFEPVSTGRVMSRTEWARETLPFWQQLCEPVAGSVAEALLEALRSNLPEEMRASLGQAVQVMRAMATTVFVVQLGQVVGQLAAETVSANEIGIPAMPDNEPALLPQNIHEFSQGLEVPVEEITIFLATRELAHVALFRHAPWLTSELTSAITSYARGIQIDVSRIESLGGEIDPSDLDSLRGAVQRGELIPPRTDDQNAALARIELLLALIEGWVDTVTGAAVRRLPKGAAVAEAVTRRRAIGGPAEHAFGTLIGLEFRPRQLRKAAALWSKVTDALGSADRDAIWQHPDLLPTTDELDAPEAFISRARGDEQTDFDRDLARLLEGDLPDSPKPDDDSEGDAPKQG